MRRGGFGPPVAGGAPWAGSPGDVAGERRPRAVAGTGDAHRLVVTNRDLSGQCRPKDPYRLRQDSTTEARRHGGFLGFLSCDLRVSVPLWWVLAYGIEGLHRERVAAVRVEQLGRAGVSLADDGRQARQHEMKLFRRRKSFISC